jgi:hypothetical protein
VHGPGVGAQHGPRGHHSIVRGEAQVSRSEHTSRQISDRPAKRATTSLDTPRCRVSSMCDSRLTLEPSQRSRSTNCGPISERAVFPLLSRYEHCALGPIRGPMIFRRSACVHTVWVSHYASLLQHAVVLPCRSPWSQVVRPSHVCSVQTPVRNGSFVHKGFLTGQASYTSTSKRHPGQPGRQGVPHPGRHPSRRWRAEYRACEQQSVVLDVGPKYGSISDKGAGSQYQACAAHISPRIDAGRELTHDGRQPCSSSSIKFSQPLPRNRCMRWASWTWL